MEDHLNNLLGKTSVQLKFSFDEVNKASTDEDLKRLVDEHKQHLDKAIVSNHVLQDDYEKIAEYIKNNPSKESLNTVAKYNTGVTIDIDKLFDNLMDKKPLKKTIINLTTKQKAEKHFNNLVEENRKQNIKNLSTQELDKAYNDLLNKEKQNITKHFDNLVKAKVVDTTEQPTTVDTNKRQFVKQEMKAIELIAKRIKQNTLSVGDFSKQFILELKNESKYKTLDLKHFTTKQLERLWDFSRNSVNEKFGI